MIDRDDHETVRVSYRHIVSHSLPMSDNGKPVGYDMLRMTEHGLEKLVFSVLRYGTLKLP